MCLVSIDIPSLLYLEVLYKMIDYSECLVEIFENYEVVTLKNVCYFFQLFRSNDETLYSL